MSSVICKAKSTQIIANNIIVAGNIYDVENPESYGALFEPFKGKHTGEAQKIKPHPDSQQEQSKDESAPKTPKKNNPTKTPKKNNPTKTPKKNNPTNDQEKPGGIEEAGSGQNNLDEPQGEDKQHEGE